MPRRRPLNECEDVPITLFRCNIIGVGGLDRSLDRRHDGQQPAGQVNDYESAVVQRKKCVQHTGRRPGLKNSESLNHMTMMKTLGLQTTAEAITALPLPLTIGVNIDVEEIFRAGGISALDAFFSMTNQF